MHRYTYYYLTLYEIFIAMTGKSKMTELTPIMLIRGLVVLILRMISICPTKTIADWNCPGNWDFCGENVLHPEQRIINCKVQNHTNTSLIKCAKQCTTFSSISDLCGGFTFDKASRSCILCQNVCGTGQPKIHNIMQVLQRQVEGKMI